MSKWCWAWSTALVLMSCSQTCPEGEAADGSCLEPGDGCPPGLARDQAGECAVPDTGPGPDDEPLPIPVDDRFDLSSPGPIDVLLLIDNSCSMADKQSRLALLMPEFLNQLEGWGFDFHVGAISTDMSTYGQPEPHNSRGRLREVDGVRYVTPITPGGFATLSSIVTMGTSGTGDERGREPILAALQTHRYARNAGFQRDEAQLHVVVYSDEDDHTGAWNGGPDGNPSRAEFIDFLQTLKGDGPAVRFHSIVNTPGSPYPFGEETGHEYIAVSQAVGGTIARIMDPLAPAVDAIVRDAARSAREFFLSETPIVDTLEVHTLDGGTRVDFTRDEWTYHEHRNSVTFESYLPLPHVEVVVTYETIAAGQ